MTALYVTTTCLILIVGAGLAAILDSFTTHGLTERKRPMITVYLTIVGTLLVLVAGLIALLTWRWAVTGFSTPGPVYVLVSACIVEVLLLRGGVRLWAYSRRGRPFGR